MSSDKNFPQRHITKRSLEKSNACTFSSYIIQTLLKHSRLFAFVRASHLKNIIQNRGNERVFLNRSIEYFKISLSRSFIPPLLRKNYSRLPFLSSRRTQYPFIFHILFLSCPFLFHSLSLYTISVHMYTYTKRSHASCHEMISIVA